MHFLSGVFVSSDEFSHSDTHTLLHFCFPSLPFIGVRAWTGSEYVTPKAFPGCGRINCLLEILLQFLALQTDVYFSLQAAEVIVEYTCAHTHTHRTCKLSIICSHGRERT